MSLSILNRYISLDNLARVTDSLLLLALESSLIGSSHEELTDEEFLQAISNLDINLYAHIIDYTRTMEFLYDEEHPLLNKLNEAKSFADKLAIASGSDFRTASEELRIKLAERFPLNSRKDNYMLGLSSGRLSSMFGNDGLFENILALDVSNQHSSQQVYDLSVEIYDYAQNNQSNLAGILSVLANFFFLLEEPYYRNVMLALVNLANNPQEPVETNFARIALTNNFSRAAKLDSERYLLLVQQEIQHLTDNIEVTDNELRRAAVVTAFHDGNTLVFDSSKEFIGTFLIDDIEDSVIIKTEEEGLVITKDFSEFSLAVANNEYKLVSSEA